MLSRCIAGVILVVAVVSILSLPCVSQQNCPVPPSIQPVSHDQDFFSDQQEVDLGDALAEQFGQHIKIIDDDNIKYIPSHLG